MAVNDGIEDNNDDIVVCGNGGAEDDYVASDHEELVNNEADDVMEAVQIEVVPQVPAPPTPQAAPPTPVSRWTEDARGYIRVPGHGAAIGRITAWGKSVSARCMLPGHVRCTRPYTFTALPNGNTLPEWLIAGIALDSAAHKVLPKPQSQGNSQL